MNPTSALTHSDGSGVCASFLKIAGADAVHSKGFDVLLWALIYRLMAPSRSATDLKTPRRIFLRVMVEKIPSTALSHDAEVGVKWQVHRG